MNRFFLKVIFRSLVMRGVFSIINIMGLSISLAVVLLMYLQIQDELSYDKSYKESNNIYRVNAHWHLYRTGEITAITPAGLAKTMKDKIPGVKSAIRIFERAHILKVGNFEEDTRVYWTDEDFFLLFDRPILYGSTEEMLKRPDGFALSESKARIMFGNINPVGEKVLFGPSSMEICAVYKDFPRNSSFSEFHVMGSINNRPIYNEPQAKNDFVGDSHSNRVVGWKSVFAVLCFPYSCFVVDVCRSSANYGLSNAAYRERVSNKGGIS